MYNKFENISSAFFISVAAALLYSLLVLLVGVLPLLFEKSLFFFLYFFLWVGFVISSLYAFAMFFLWFGRLSFFANGHELGKKNMLVIQFLSFFIPIYNFFGPYTIFANFADSLNIKGGKFIYALWQLLFCATGVSFGFSIYMFFHTTGMFTYMLYLYSFALALIFNIAYLATLLVITKRFGDGVKIFFDGKAERG